MYLNYKLKDDESFVGASRILSIDHTCPCCQKKYFRVPALAVENELGYWWNCACKTTIVQLPEQIKVAS